MNGQGHARTTLAAIEALPGWQQELWYPEKTALAEEYALFGDTYALRKRELGPFVELPDGTVPDFYMPRLRQKHHCDAAIDYWEAPFYDKALATFRYFPERIVAALRRNDIGAAARFAGTLAHYIQDNACPGHAMDETDLEIVKDLLPPPERLRRFPFHARMELAPVPFSLDGRPPRLHGRSVTEAAGAFVDSLVELTLASRKTVLPFFRSFYEGDDDRAAELNQANCRMAAALLADVLYTVTSIACGRYENTEQPEEGRRSLANAYPWRQTAWAPEPYAQIAPRELVGVNLNMDYDPVPCALHGDAGGGNRPVDVANALGATAFFEYDFCVPRGVYARFTATYGIHATLGSRCPILFEIYGDDRLLFRDARCAGDPAGAVALAWPSDAEHLRLITTLPDSVEMPRINDRPIAPTGHAVWADPVLTREARRPRGMA